MNYDTENGVIIMYNDRKREHEEPPKVRKLSDVGAKIGKRAQEKPPQTTTTMSMNKCNTTARDLLAVKAMMAELEADVEALTDKIRESGNKLQQREQHQKERNHWT